MKFGNLTESSSHRRICSEHTTQLYQIFSSCSVVQSAVREDGQERTKYNGREIADRNRIAQAHQRSGMLEIFRGARLILFQSKSDDFGRKRSDP